jgi:hypothetical protein
VYSTQSMVRMATKVRRSLEPQVVDPHNALCSGIEDVLVAARLLKKQYRLMTVARRGNWSMAITRLQENLLGRLNQLHDAAGEILQRSRPQVRIGLPSLRDLYEELLQLQQEFNSLDLDLKAGVISVETEDIELEGVYLGAFRITLPLAQLARRADCNIFQIEALDPHPADSNSEVVHPHVQGERLCMGDATATVTMALKTGRLADAFLAVNAVLHTYNQASPYIALDEWYGTRCGDCDRLVDNDDSYTCSACESTFCEDCTACCDQCQNVYCMTCLERTDEREFQYLCESCRDRCRECQTLMGSKSLKDGLCPACHQQHQTQEQENKHEQSVANDTKSAVADSSPTIASDDLPETATPASARTRGNDPAVCTPGLA